MGDWLVAVGLELFDNASISYDSSLFEAIHAFADFHVDISVTYEGVQIIFVHDFLWDVLDWDLHVLEVVHGVVQVKVRYV